MNAREPSEPEVKVCQAQAQFLTMDQAQKQRNNRRRFVMPRLLGQYLSIFALVPEAVFFPRKSANQKSCTQKVPFVPCGRGLCPNCGARCAQDSSEDGFVRIETRKLSKKEISELSRWSLGPLAAKMCPRPQREKTAFWPKRPPTTSDALNLSQRENWTAQNDCDVNH